MKKDFKWLKLLVAAYSISKFGFKAAAHTLEVDDIKDLCEGIWCLLDVLLS